MIMGQVFPSKFGELYGLTNMYQKVNSKHKNNINSYACFSVFHFLYDFYYNSTIKNYTNLDDIAHLVIHEKKSIHYLSWGNFKI